MMLKWLGPAAALLAFAAPASAQTVRAQSPQSLVDALQNAGYAAKLGTDRVGDPMITSGVAGTTFQIFFYNCTDHRNCATVQFHSAYDLSTPVATRASARSRRAETRSRLSLSQAPLPFSAQ